jgi:hypothetical protein
LQLLFMTDQWLMLSWVLCMFAAFFYDWPMTDVELTFFFYHLCHSAAKMMNAGPMILASPLP